MINYNFLYDVFLVTLQFPIDLLGPKGRAIHIEGGCSGAGISNSWSHDAAVAQIRWVAKSTKY
jgi:hypothetical protein